MSPIPAHLEDPARASNPASPRYRSILAVELTHLGDLVSALPAIRLLSESFRPDVMYVVVDEQYADLVAALEGGLTPLGMARTRTLPGFLRVLSAVRRLHPDLALSMSPARRNAYAARFSGAPVTAGFLHGGGAPAHHTVESVVSSRGLSRPPIRFPRGEHIEQRALSVCRMLGLETAEMSGAWRLQDSVVRDVRPRLQREGQLPEGKYIVIHPGARWSRRRWPADRFAILIRALLEAVPHHVLLLSSGDDSEIVAPLVATLSQFPRFRSVTPPGVRDAAVLMAGADLFVGNDSGPLHLAAALGVRCVGLYGPTSPEFTAPRGGTVDTLYKKISCSPCDQKSCPFATALCMEAIGADEVTRSVLAALSLVPGPGLPANG